MIQVPPKYLKQFTEKTPIENSSKKSVSTLCLYFSNSAKACIRIDVFSQPMAKLSKKMFKGRKTLTAKLREVKESNDQPLNDWQAKKPSLPNKSEPCLRNSLVAH